MASLCLVHNPTLTVAGKDKQISCGVPIEPSVSSHPPSGGACHPLPTFSLLVVTLTFLLRLVLLLRSPAWQMPLMSSSLLNLMMLVINIAATLFKLSRES